MDFLGLPAVDLPSYDISQHFSVAADFIQVQNTDDILDKDDIKVYKDELENFTKFSFILQKELFCRGGGFGGYFFIVLNVTTFWLVF